MHPCLAINLRQGREKMSRAPRSRPPRYSAQVSNGGATLTQPPLPPRGLDHRPPPPPPGLFTSSTTETPGQGAPTSLGRPRPFPSVSPPQPPSRSLSSPRLFSRRHRSPSYTHAIFVPSLSSSSPLPPAFTYFLLFLHLGPALKGSGPSGPHPSPRGAFSFGAQRHDLLGRVKRQTPPDPRASTPRLLRRLQPLASGKRGVDARPESGGEGRSAATSPVHLKRTM